jgi:hypothetical protein
MEETQEYDGGDRAEPGGTQELRINKKQIKRSAPTHCL